MKGLRDRISLEHFADVSRVVHDQGANDAHDKILRPHMFHVHKRSPNFLELKSVGDTQQRLGRRHDK